MHRLLLLLLALQLHALDLYKYLDQIRKPTPTWMSERIEKDLRPFSKTNLSKYALDEIFNNVRGALFRIRVQGGVMTIEKAEDAQSHPVIDVWAPHFQGLHHVSPLPDVDIILTASDGLGCRPNGPALPIFTFSKCREDQGMILIPDWFALDAYTPYPHVQEVLIGNDLYPWENKKDLLFFRGSDSCVSMDDSTYEGWKKAPRPQLVSLSLRYPLLIDAKFAFSLHRKQFLDQATKDGYLGNYVYMRDQIQYKYLLDIDGNCAPTPRLPLILHSNSVCLKMVTNQIQWFYDALIPYVHYVPLREDFTDIFTQLLWAKNHQDECKKISAQARQLVNEILSRESVYEYLYRVITAYAKVQTSGRTDPIPFEFSIPDEKIIDFIPDKDQDFGTTIPYDINTFIFTDEADYYKDYQRSYFGITRKKAGADCMRHYEILANGCIPYFLDLDACDPKTMPFLPRELIKEAMNLEGVSYPHINHTKFNRAKYYEILHKLLSHTRKHLASSKMATYLLKSMSYSGNGPILYLSNDKGEDYLKALTLIGLKSLLGTNIIDVPKLDYIYTNYPLEQAKILYGKGFSYTRIMEDLPVDRDSIETRIRNKEFELILYSMPHVGMPFYDLVNECYPPEKIGYLCGSDAHQCSLSHFPNLFLREYDSYQK